ncbi:hypothetical protein GPALN_010566 [Globodera pallida]|nr:hypothetical protein GPALN_010566 [Globodera pallida]
MVDKEQKWSMVRERIKQAEETAETFDATEAQLEELPTDCVEDAFSRSEVAANFIIQVPHVFSKQRHSVEKSAEAVNFYSEYNPNTELDIFEIDNEAIEKQLCQFEKTKEFIDKQTELGLEQLTKANRAAFWTESLELPVIETDEKQDESEPKNDWLHDISSVDISAVDISAVDISSVDISSVDTSSVDISSRKTAFVKRCTDCKPRKAGASVCCCFESRNQHRFFHGDQAKSLKELLEQAER